MKLGLVILATCLLLITTPAAALSQVPAIDYQVAAKDAAWSQLPADKWQSVPQALPSFGYTDDIYWYRFNVPANSVDRVVHISYSLLDDIQVHFVRHGSLLQRLQLGDRQPFAERPVRHKDFVVPVPTQEAVTVYVRVDSDSSMRVPIRIFEHAEFLDAQTTYSQATGLYFGVVICMAVYNLFGFFLSRERSFLTYSSYTVLMGLLMAGLDGSGYRYLWPELPWLQERAVPFFGSLVFILAALFTAQLLKLKRYSKRVFGGLTFMASVFGVLFIATVLLSYGAVIKFLLILAVPACVFLFGIGVYMWRKGHIYARVFTVAWATFLLSVISNSLGYLGLVDGLFIQRYAIMVGSGIEILLLSWVLALRYAEERKAKVAAQADALERAEEVQQAQQDLNEQLEEKVAERTFELEVTLRELQETNAELEQKSSEDALTGIFNRRYLNRHLEMEFRRAYREQTPLALIMLDIDYFKPVNDEHGHLVGDQVLRSLALLLQGLLKRPSDVVCRYGGEEFAILLPATDWEGAMILAKKISLDVANHDFKTDAGDLTITVSLGVAVAQAGQYARAEQLLGAADQALYAAKSAGRNQVRKAISGNADPSISS